jgi:hypothetical protein
VTPASDAPAATAATAKRTAALLRDARSVQRRLDTLAATALAIDDPSLPRIAVARGAVERLVVELTYRERGEQRRAREPRRRAGPPPTAPYRSV